LYFFLSISDRNIDFDRLPEISIKLLQLFLIRGACTAKAGMDLEMPNGKYLGDKLLKKIQEGEVDESILDDKVERILRIMFRMGLFGETPEAYGGYMNTPERKALA